MPGPSTKWRKWSLSYLYESSIAEVSEGDNKLAQELEEIHQD